MRAFDQGSLVRVTISEREVWDFKQNWPCSGLPNVGLSFVFDKDNGDLKDAHPDTKLRNADGAALNAIIDNAKDYAKEKGLMAHIPLPSGFRW